MSFANFVETQLPCMRRYAFAVLDDISRADACVEQVLLNLLEERSVSGAALQPMRRVDLFVRLQHVLQTSAMVRRQDRSRHVLLLLEMEQLSINKVSLILDIPLEDLWRLVNSEEYAALRIAALRHAVL
ncbi:MAG: hypothetical protein AAF437_02385 [Pseudomonadota bacterium]